MAYEFKRLADVEALSEVPENATVLAEVNGSIKRVPGNGLGGSGKGLVLVQDVADSADPAPMEVAAPYTYTTNMTLEEAMELFATYELSSVAVYVPMDTASPSATDSTSSSSSMMLDYAFAADQSSYYGQNCLVFMTLQSNTTIFWTANGASTDAPSGGDK